MTQCSKARHSTGFAIFNTRIYAKLSIKFAAKEKLEIVKVQDFGSLLRQRLRTGRRNFWTDPRRRRRRNTSELL